MSLNNNQVAEVLNEAFAQATGSKEIGQLTLQEIIDTGNDVTIIGSKEQFTKALVNVLTRNWFTDTSYRSSYVDPFFQDSEQFGAIMQMISVEIPDAQASHAWQDFGTGDGKVSKIGLYDVYMPVVEAQYYGKTVSWEIPITITGEQWDTAFTNESELKGFVAYVLMCVDNGIVVHLEDMNNANRNNFIAEKIAYAKSPEAKGLHVYDLVKEYQKETGNLSTSMTASEFRNDPKAMLFMTEKLRLYKDYFKKMNTIFNTAGKKRFTPEDRIVLQVLSAIDQRLRTVATSDTYNKDIVEMPGFESVAYWQGTGEDFGFDNVSSINVKISSDGTAIEESGIVALLVDKWAIMHTIKKQRVAAKVFEPEDLTNYYNQFRDMYANNLTLNGLVFVIKDYVAG